MEGELRRSDGGLSAVEQATANYMDRIEAAGGRAAGPAVLYVDPQDHQDPEHAGEFIVCETCGVPLNRLTTLAGEVEWLHSRGWKEYDHQPVPVAGDRRNVEDTCDFCATVGIGYWVYVGGRIRNRVGNTVNDLGSRWSACQQCGPFIDNGDLQGLRQRVLRVAPSVQNMPRREREQMGDHYVQLWSAFLPTIIDRQYIGPQRPPTKLHPRLMPKLQAGLIKFWSNEDFQRIACQSLLTFSASLPGVHLGDEDTFMVRFPPDTPVPQRAFTNHAHHIAAGVGVADMYWISENFTRLAVHAGKRFEKLVVTREELPSSFGFMVFADPIGEINRPGGQAAVRAVTWTLVPGGVWLNLYMQGEDGDSEIDIETMRSELGYLMCPNAGLGFKFDDEIPIPEDETLGFVNTILATWALINQPGVAGIQDGPVDKAYARSYTRRYRRPPPPVRLVDLRKRPRPDRQKINATGRTWKERRIVHGHWKRQFYGTKRALRKWIYVDDYIAGPDDAPLREPRTPVKVLR